MFFQIQNELKKLKDEAGSGTTVEGGDEDNEDEDEDNDAENVHKDEEETKVGEQLVAEEVLINEVDQTSKDVELIEEEDTKEETLNWHNKWMKLFKNFNFYCIRKMRTLTHNLPCYH